MEATTLEKKEDPELVKQRDEFLKQMVIKRYHYILTQIYNRLYKQQCSLVDLQEEIKQKKSPLSTSQRTFIMDFKIDFIEDLLKIMYNQKQLYGIKFTECKEN